MATKQQIEDLGTKCADLAWKNGGSDRGHDGKLLMGTEPVGGDFDALTELLGRDYHDDADADLTFEAAYRERAESLIEAANG